MISLATHYKALLVFEAPVHMVDTEALSTHTNSLLEKFKKRTKEENVLCLFGDGLKSRPRSDKENEENPADNDAESSSISEKAQEEEHIIF